MHDSNLIYSVQTTEYAAMHLSSSLKRNTTEHSQINSDAVMALRLGAL